VGTRRQRPGEPELKEKKKKTEGGHRGASGPPPTGVGAGEKRTGSEGSQPVRGSEHRGGACEGKLRAGGNGGGPSAEKRGLGGGETRSGGITRREAGPGHASCARSPRNGVLQVPFSRRRGFLLLQRTVGARPRWERVGARIRGRAKKAEWVQGGGLCDTGGPFRGALCLLGKISWGEWAFPLACFVIGFFGFAPVARRRAA